MAQYKNPEEDRWWNEKALAAGIGKGLLDVVGTAVALPFRTAQEIGGGLLSLLEAVSYTHLTLPTILLV